MSELARNAALTLLLALAAFIIGLSIGDSCGEARAREAGLHRISPRLLGDFPQ